MKKLSNKEDGCVHESVSVCMCAYVLVGVGGWVGVCVSYGNKENGEELLSDRVQ